MPMPSRIVNTDSEMRFGKCRPLDAVKGPAMSPVCMRASLKSLRRTHADNQDWTRRGCIVVL